jgi:predicted RNase H-like HicB family nuclease
MKHYVALVHHEPGTSYGVMFPDFPGCISAGKNFEEARANASEALAAHVELMLADGDAIPKPRNWESIRKANKDCEGQSVRCWVDFKNAIVTMIPLLPVAGKPVRLNVSLDKNLVKTIDHVASSRGMTRSGFLAEAARRAIEGDTRI